MQPRRLTLWLFVALCAAASPASAQDTHSHLAQRLTKALGKRVEYAQLSPDGAYAALVLEKDLALTTSSGKVIWTRARTAVNPFLTGWELTCAAAPGGRLFAVSGGASFRTVLLLDAKGRSLQYLRTRGTPEGLAFDHRGRRLAVGTAAGWLYVVSLGPPYRSKPHPLRAFPGGAVRRVGLGGILGELAYSPNDRFLATTFSGGTAALMNGFGAPIWRHSVDYYATLDASKDWRWFAICETPSHGPFYGTVSLVSRSGKKRWSVPYRDPQAAVSADDRFVLMRAGPDAPPAGGASEPPVGWRVADWKGHELRRTGKGGHPRFTAPGGIVLTLRGMTWTATRHGRILWTTRTEFYKPDTG